MGSIFEELVRRFNEENNEEAGEHWTPRGRRAADGEPGVPAHRRRDRVRHVPGVRRRLWHRWHADGRRGDARTTRQGPRQGSLDAPLRAGDQRGDRSDRQVRLLAQGRGRGRRQPHRRAGALDALKRRICRSRVRLHALQPALREELEERPGADGWQGGHP